MHLVSPSNVMVSINGGSTPVSGTSTTMDCSVTLGNPTGTTYTWTREGSIVQAASSMSSYTFTPGDTDNGKTYACTASNGIDTDPSGSIVLPVNCKHHHNKSALQIKEEANP